MGLYVQSGLTNNPSSNVDLRRKSLDLLSMDGEVKDDGRHIDIGRDSVIDPSDIAAIIRQKNSKKKNRVRRRMNTLLHTHIALIAVSILSSLDAVCVIGQVICDILIMSDKLADYDKLHEGAAVIIVDLLPDLFNETDTSHWSFEKIIEHLESHSSPESLHVSNHSDDSHIDHGHDSGEHADDNFSSISSVLQPLVNSVIQHTRFRRNVDVGQARASADGHDGEHEEHDLLHELTHSFHIGSLVLLSILLAETLCKIFAMWTGFLHHKLEVFDAFVIMVSWSLDVAFWEGIWARPGQEGATLLIFMLPWRVIRIVNSFILVIQEKDLVLLKLVKQRLRSALRKDKDTSAKLDKYRLEVRQLQGLCRKSGADETAIQACCPTGRRRRSSLFQSLTSLASVALVSAMGSSPDIEKDNVSSSDSENEEENKNKKMLSRSDLNSDVDVDVTFSLSPMTDVTSVSSGNPNEAFTFDDESVDNFRGSTVLNESFKTRL